MKIATKVGERLQLTKGSRFREGYELGSSLTATQPDCRVQVNFVEFPFVWSLPRGIWLLSQSFAFVSVLMDQLADYTNLESMAMPSLIVNSCRKLIGCSELSA